MFYLLELRERIKKFYQEKESIALAISKFLISFIVFFITTKALNYNELLCNPLIILILAFIGAFVPTVILAFVVMIVACFEVFCFSPILGGVVFGVMIILYCLFIRFAPKYGIAIVAVPIAFAIKMPCLVPIVLGIVATPVTAIAVAFGTIAYYLFESVIQVEKIIGDSAGEVSEVYVYLVNQIKDNSALVFSVIVFAFITIMVYVIRTREIDYAPEMAIVTGGIVNLLAFLIADLTNAVSLPMSIIGLIFGTLGACLIAFIIQYFKCALDYSAIERVQFEDDDYYYFVKAVPKMKVATQQNDVKKIQSQKPVAQKNDDDFNVADIFKEKDFETEDELDNDFSVVADRMESADIDVDKEFEEKIEKDLEKSLERDMEQFEK